MLAVDTELNWCASDPCRQGVCTFGPNRYSCKCYRGYEGYNCDRGKYAIRTLLHQWIYYSIYQQLSWLS